MDEILKLLAAFLTPTTVIIFLILYYPDKIEKWSALGWKVIARLGSLTGWFFAGAHKRYVKHDLQGRVNDFVRQLRKHVPTLALLKLKLVWIDPATPRKSFIEKGKVVIRLRKEDPGDQNFVHGAYLFVSGTLLHKTKRYLSLPQKEAVDLFVCAQLLEREKPAVVEAFLAEYLHPKTDDAKSKVACYMDDFATLHSRSLFFPLFLREIEYLGDRVFGRRRDTAIVTEVNGMVDFLKCIANRTVGEEGDLNFEGAYCRFGIVIVGRPTKLEREDIRPYVNYIRKVLVTPGVETIYILAREENSKRVLEICNTFKDEYTCVRRFNYSTELRYPDRLQMVRQHLSILRKHGIRLIRPGDARATTSISDQDTEELEA